MVLPDLRTDLKGTSKTLRASQQTCATELRSALSQVADTVRIFRIKTFSKTFTWIPVLTCFTPRYRIPEGEFRAPRVQSLSSSSDFCICVMCCVSDPRSDYHNAR